MVKKDNTPKKAEAPQGEHPAEGTVQEEPRVEFRKKAPDMEKYRKMVAEEEGVDPSELEDEHVNIRAMATQGAQEETKEKPEETKEGEIEGEIPERYKGKTSEELIKLLDEKEKYIQSRSDEFGEMKKKLTKADEIEKKIQAIESQMLKGTQKMPSLPEAPKPPEVSENEYYDDPIKALKKLSEYNKQLAEWNKQYINAMVSPYYEDKAKTSKNELLQQLEVKYKDWPVKFEPKKIQEFLDKNPEYFTNYRVNAYEKAYHDLAAEEFSQLSKKQQGEMREQVKKELLEEMDTQKQAGNVGLHDLQTQDLSGSSPAYDEERMEEDAEYRRQVLSDIEKRRKS